MRGFLDKLLSWCTLPALGMVLTVNYVLLVYWRFNDRFFQLEKMPLNEVGDFLAGAFGPVAFGWLIIGYVMQNKELRNSSNQAEHAQKLTMNQIDFQKSVEASRKKERANMARPIFECDVFASDEERRDISDFSINKLNYKKNKISFGVKLTVFKNDVHDFSLHNQYQVKEGFFILPISFPVIKVGDEGKELKIDVNKDGLKCLIEDEEIKIPFSFLDVNGEVCKNFLHVIKLHDSIACRFFTRKVR
tara:strand:+ start:218 stop:958 length:741 start_codon:yes stop_codon:yes gene_type:complete